MDYQDFIDIFGKYDLEGDIEIILIGDISI